MKICPVRADLFHAYRRTDMTKVTVAFRNYAKNAENFEIITDRNHKMTKIPSALSQKNV